MTEGKIDIKDALRSFEIIRSRGIRKEDGHHYQGLRASTDFDGYTVFIENDYVTLTIAFHNKFDFTYTNAKERDAFLDKLRLIAKAT